MTTCPVDRYQMIYAFELPGDLSALDEDALHCEVENKMLVLFDSLRDKFPDHYMRLKQTVVFASAEEEL